MAVNRCRISEAIPHATYTLFHLWRDHPYRYLIPCEGPVLIKYKKNINKMSSVVTLVININHGFIDIWSESKRIISRGYSDPSASIFTVTETIYPNIYFMAF